MVRKPDATTQRTPQDNQLMSNHRVLSFNPQHRLEWQGQDGQNETEQPDHSASLGDAITASTQIRFSVHTAFAFAQTSCPSLIVTTIVKSGLLETHSVLVDLHIAGYDDRDKAPDEIGARVSALCCETQPPHTSLKAAGCARALKRSLVMERPP
jgi:hypothetical protein